MHLRAVLLMVSATAGLAIATACGGGDDSFFTIEPDVEPGDVGACDAPLSRAEYDADPGRVDGSVLAGHPRRRPAFAMHREVLSRKFLAGGALDDAGLLVQFDADGNLDWARRLSRCEWDQIDDAASFRGGAYAVTRTYTEAGQCHTDLMAWSVEGDLLWRTPIYSAPCFQPWIPGSQVAVSRSDGTAIVAVNTESQDELYVARVGRDGTVTDTRTISTADLSTSLGLVATSLATTPAHADDDEILIGLKHGAMLLDTSLATRWWVELADSHFRDHLEGSVEVAACTPGRFTLAVAGVEWFGGEHSVTEYDADGDEDWAIRLPSASVKAGTPAYTGPTGLLRGERANLRCGADIAHLAFVGGDSGEERTSEAVAVSLDASGASSSPHGGAVPDGVTWVGTEGADNADPRFLVIDDGKFDVLRPDELGWSVR